MNLNVKKEDNTLTKLLNNKIMYEFKILKMKITYELECSKRRLCMNLNIIEEDNI